MTDLSQRNSKASAAAVPPMLTVMGLLVVAACSARTPPAPATPAALPWSAPPLEQSISVRDSTGGRPSWTEAVERLSAADVVFIGETHTDETTHRVELGLLTELAARRPVVLSLEMLERDVQPALDAWLADELDTPGLLEAIRPWSNHSVAYQPLLDAAKARGIPVVAANFPRPWLRRVGGVDDPFADFSEEEQARLPTTLLPNSPGYWRRADNAMRGHMGRMPTPTEESRLVSVQSLWDNAMGDAVAGALERWPGHLVVHVVGGFHTAFGEGTAEQVQARRPDADVRTVAVVPVGVPASAVFQGRSLGDFVVFAEARASDPFSGHHSVTLPSRLRYRLHRPEVEDAPLLLWLPDDGLTSADGLELWRDRLGDDVVIASFDPPYRSIQGDGAEGGRWSWPDTFGQDVSAAVYGVERAWAYVLRNHDVDPERVVIAGEGSGATVAAMVTLRTSRVAHAGVALHPSGARPVRDLPLPLPEEGDAPLPERTLTVVSTAELWDSEAPAYSELGLPTRVIAPAEDAWLRETQAEGLLRAALGLPGAEDGPRVHLVLEDPDPRAHYWARLAGLRHGPRAAVVGAEVEGVESTRVELEVTPERASEEGFLPRCPGAFGGTTVLVLPDGADAAAWAALGEADPIAAKSRFHRLRIVTLDSLESQLLELEERGRINVLVVPAVFHADPGMMADLKRRVAHLEERLTITLRPGLGDRLRPPAQD